MSAAQLGDRRFTWFEEVGSTNEVARESALAGGPDGHWFIAARQTAGRGRHGRSWASPSGNFHGSLLVRTERGLAEAATLALVAGLALSEAIDDVTDGRLLARLKWPNDLLVGEAKLAGVLLEGGQSETGGAWVVIGIGVNLASHPGAAYPTTSLKALGASGIAPEHFALVLDRSMARRLATWREAGFAALRQAWLDRALGLGSPVTLRTGTDLHKGCLADLGADGSILIETPLGCLLRFTAGELFFNGAAGVS